MSRHEVRYYKPSPPRPALPHVIPSVNELTAAYHEYGVHNATLDDMPQLCAFDTSFSRTYSDNRDFYKGWLQYELGFAQQHVAPEATFGHYIKAQALLRQDQLHNPRLVKQLNASKNIALIGLLGARLDANERQYSLQRRATAGELGSLASRSIADIRALANGSDDHISEQGLLSELVMGGVLLSMAGETEPRDVFIPAPATPRQDAPRGDARFDQPAKPGGALTSKAHDYNLLVYTEAEPLPRAIIPTQVKTRERGYRKEFKYSPSVMMLYADRELFTETLTEFQNLAAELEVYGRTKQIGSTLADAQSNVAFAIELFENLDES